MYNNSRLLSAKNTTPLARHASAKASNDEVIIISPVAASPAVKTTRGCRGVPPAGQCL